MIKAIKKAFFCIFELQLRTLPSSNFSYQYWPMNRAPFGSVIGYAAGDIPVYSSNYDWHILCDLCCGRLTNKSESGVYYGFKYQCVEFARRWLVNVLGVTFASVEMAYEVFELLNFQQLSDMGPVFVEDIKNGCTDADKRPAYGNVIIWNEGGYFHKTGHIGIITEANDRYVRIAEQNFDDLYWSEGRNYSRELPVHIDAESGAYNIIDLTEPEDSSHGKTSVCGWIRVLLTENQQQSQVSP